MTVPPDKIKQSDKERKKRVHDYFKRQDDEHKKRLDDYVASTLYLIKPDKQKEWKVCVKKNYGGMLDASVDAMKALSEGKTPAEAVQRTYQHDLSGAMGSNIDGAVEYYHKRGAEYRQFLEERKNKSYDAWFEKDEKTPRKSPYRNPAGHGKLLKWRAREYLASKKK